MTIYIDNKKIKIDKEKTILEAATANGIEIPHFCEHPSLEPYGACRICMVEVEKNSWRTLTTSCTHPVKDGMKIFTDSENVIEARKFAVRLLQMLAPEADSIRELAKKLKMKEAEYDLRNESDNCIRCGLCVRVCREMIGKEAISFINRGIKRIPETPFLENNPDCISCGACAYLCPTGRITVTDSGNIREIKEWHKKEEMAECPECKTLFMPKNELLHVKEKMKEAGIPADIIELADICTPCRNRKTMKNFTENNKL